MATITRPTGGYTPSNPITNTTKYQDDSAATSPRVAISSVKVDGDINKAFDTLTEHDDAIVALQTPVASLTEVVVDATDSFVLADASDSDLLKRDTIQGIIDLALAQIAANPVGAVMPYAGNSAPTGWLLARGQAVSRTTYASLFSVISTTYGSGDGSTTFNLPDLQGRVVAGVEATATRLTSGVSGVDGGTLGASGGNQNMHQHTHTANVSDPGHTHQIADSTPAGSLGVNRSGSTGGNSFGTLSSTTGITVTNVNAGSGSSQNVQPTIVLNYIIKH